MHTYRYVEGVWTFLLEDANFIFAGGNSTEKVAVKKVKIVACEPPKV
jgi:hypothetical protein